MHSVIEDYFHADEIGVAALISDEENRLGRSLPINSLLNLSALQNERRLNINRIAEITHIGVNPAKANVAKLVESGLVEELGMGKAREYILSAKVYRMFLCITLQSRTIADRHLFLQSPSKLKAII